MSPGTITSSALAALACAAALAQAPAPNLAPNPEFRLDAAGAPAGWKAWSPRPALAPASRVMAEPGGSVLRLEARDAASFGKWLASPVPVRPLAFYEFEVRYRPEGLADDASSVSVMLSWNGADGRPVQRDYVDRISPAASGWRLASRTLRAPEKAASVSIELWLRWTPSGSVSFNHPRLSEVAAPARRTARIVTTRIPARPGATPANNLQYMAEILDRAGRERPDLILLTENFVDQGLPAPPHQWAQPVPGPATELLAQQARQYKSYIATSLLESDADRVYITAVLLDREGRLAGKFRKIHLPLAEVEDGVTSGSDYPVFATDFGRVGLLVCWDNWFPEAARILRLKGAEILLWPLAGDGDARHFDIISRARAIDNGVYVVASSGHGSTSRIVDPDGNVLAEAADGLATADLDLNKEWRLYWLSVGPADGEGRSLYLKERRPETYGPLLKAQ